MPDGPFPDLVARLRDLAADPAAGPTDADLLARFVRDRDAVAFEALVWRHAGLVMGVCRRALGHHDAEDAFQATFLLLARKADRIRRGAALPAWLHTTAVRLARRARARRRPVSVPEVPERPTTDPPPESAEAWAILDEEVRRLPGKLRTAFVLCGLEGRSHADAARDLGCPTGTIDSRMASARRRLRAALTRRGVTLAPLAPLAVAVPELAHGDAARRAAAIALGRPADVSPAVAGLLAPAGRRWLVGLAAALTLAAVGAVAALSGPDRPAGPPTRPASLPPAPRYVLDTAPAWKWTTINLPPEVQHHPRPDAVAWLVHRYEKQAIVIRTKAGRPLIPPAVPVGIGPRVVYANDLGVGVFGVSDEPPQGVRRGGFCWQSDSENALTARADVLHSRAVMNSYLDKHISQAADSFFHRTLSTAFTVSPTHVHFVDELGVLPTPEGLKATRVEYFGYLADAVRFNGVKSAKFVDGKLQSKLMGKSDKWSFNPVGPTLHLGPPLLDGGLLFVVHESNRRQRLTALHWERMIESPRPDPKESGRPLVAWDTELTEAPRPASEDVYRRIHAIHLVRAGDLVVCPTHLGRVVAVEARTGQVRWTHEYAPLAAPRFPTFAPEWTVVPPAVAGDRYVYAPADFPELLCLNLADGKKVWGVPKGDGLYPAVVGDQVLVIGEKIVRSLDLADGAERWALDLPGLPCGRGAVLGETYLVPVSEPKTWKGLIAVVDLRTGALAKALRPEGDEPIGNLLVHRDYLISQTLTEIAAFPIRKQE